MSSSKFVFLGRSEYQDGRPASDYAGTFSKLDLFSETAERNLTNLDLKQELNILFKVCVFGSIGKSRWPTGLRLAETFSTSYLQPLNWIWRNLTGSKNSIFSTKCVFFGFSNRPENQDGCPWLAEFSATAERNLMKLDRKQEHNVHCKILGFFENQDGRHGLIDSYIFDFSSKIAERMWWNLAGSKNSNSCTSWSFSNRSENQDDRPASDWQRYFLPLRNRRTEVLKLYSN